VVDDARLEPRVSPRTKGEKEAATRPANGNSETEKSVSSWFSWQERRARIRDLRGDRPAILQWFQRELRRF